MLGQSPIFFDTKTIIVNLLKEDEKTFLSIERLQKLLVYIYDELKSQRKLCDYEILFDINFDSIERTVIYNSTIFALDIDGENIILKDPKEIGKLANKYKVDSTVRSIIKNFLAA